MGPRFFILGAGAIVLIAAATFGAITLTSNNGAIDAPELVRIPAGQYSHRPAGDFRAGTRVVDAPLEYYTAQNDLQIMKHHVRQSEYSACVADGGCKVTLTQGSDTLPQVDVSYLDAIAYASWLSEKTNQTWRLPTDAEWVRAAGDRFKEVILGDISNDPDPSKRWLKKYREEAQERGAIDPALRPTGSFGANNLGVVDIWGNVWEWTQSCFLNGKVSDDGVTLIESTSYCGVRSVQGKHRAFIIGFVRDAKSGGCAAGTPPDNLGFRLVRES